MAKEKDLRDKDMKFKVINETIENLEKIFGKGTIMRLGDKPYHKIEALSTGCLSLNLALGIGGIPKGRIIEIFGPPAGGKTTMSLHIVTECQKGGGTVAFIDAEHAMDLDYAHKLGVDTDNLLFSQPSCGEEALEIVDAIIRSNAVDLIVVDSVAALTPQAEIEGDMGQSHMALQARLMSQALRKITASVSKAKTCVIFINQLRDTMALWGPTEVTPGGNALKFYTSVRLDVRKISVIKKGDLIIGNKTKIKVVKNKVAPPLKEVEVDIIFGKGIDIVSDLINLGLQFNIITKEGAWYKYGEDKYQGKDQLVDTLNKNSMFIENLKASVLQHINNSE